MQDVLRTALLLVLSLWMAPGLASAESDPEALPRILRVQAHDAEHIDPSAPTQPAKILAPMDPDLLWTVRLFSVERLSMGEPCPVPALDFAALYDELATLIDFGIFENYQTVRAQLSAAIPCWQGRISSKTLANLAFWEGVVAAQEGADPTPFFLQAITLNPALPAPEHLPLNAQGAFQDALKARESLQSYPVSVPEALIPYLWIDGVQATDAVVFLTHGPHLFQLVREEDVYAAALSEVTAERPPGTPLPLPIPSADAVTEDLFAEARAGSIGPITQHWLTALQAQGDTLIVCMTDFNRILSPDGSVRDIPLVASADRSSERPSHRAKVIGLSVGAGAAAAVYLGLRTFVESKQWDALACDSPEAFRSGGCARPLVLGAYAAGVTSVGMGVGALSLGLAGKSQRGRVTLRLSPTHTEVSIQW